VSRHRKRPPASNFEALGALAAEGASRRMPDRHPAGRAMGLDVGGKRIGVAISDETWLIATPLEYVARQRNDRTHLQRLIDRWDIGHLVVGLPTGLSGREGPQAADVRAYADATAAALGLPLDYWDERFTSAIAEQSLVATGTRREARREQIDAVSAAVILQDFLDARRGRQERRARRRRDSARKEEGRND
jgi:putative Holliday junction resolvase